LDRSQLSQKEDQIVNVGNILELHENFALGKLPKVVQKVKLVPLFQIYKVNN
jgi:hypothetical protein